MQKSNVTMFYNLRHAVSWNTDDKCVGSCRFGADPGPGGLSAGQRSSTADQDHFYGKEKIEQTTDD